MAKDQISMALDENAAFEKLTQGMRYTIEACTELSVYQSRNEWLQFAVMFEKMQKNIEAFHTKCAARTASRIIRSS